MDLLTSDMVRVCYDWDKDSEHWVVIGEDQSCKSPSDISDKTIETDDKIELTTKDTFRKSVNQKVSISFKFV